jgi:hypothetical protein
MGDLDVDTRLSGGAGIYTGKLSPDWKIWGPNGGYVAAVALRAAGLESRLARPASFSCQFLEAGAFEAVDVRVETLRRGRSIGCRPSSAARRRPSCAAGIASGLARASTIRSSTPHAR